MKNTRPVTVIHLSAPQFGRHHRFGGSTASKERFSDRIADDLASLKDSYDLEPDILLVTGDLTERGLRSEFDNALRFLENLSELLALPRDHVILLPGNHDVNRKQAEAYFIMSAAEEEEPKAPFWPKWKPYSQFFDRFYQDIHRAEFTEDKPWTLMELPDLKVVVAALNSTMADSHRDEDHYGFLGEAQLRWFAEHLDSYRERGWLRIGALHHNALRGTVVDDVSLRDANDLTRILGPFLNCLLHGHAHTGGLHWLSPETPVLATGEASLHAMYRPGENLDQYQIIQLLPDRLVRSARMFAPNMERWVSDSRISPEGDDWREEYAIAFQDVWATFPGAQRSPREKAVRDRVFISYSHHDSGWLEKVRTHLTPYVRRGTLSTWDDTQIQVGSNWREAIQSALESASVALLLVSPEFLASEFIADNELPPLLEAAGEKNLVILWIPVSASSYDETEIEKYQAALDPGQPLDSQPDSEVNRLLVLTCKKIKSLMAR